MTITLSSLSPMRSVSRMETKAGGFKVSSWKIRQMDYYQYPLVILTSEKYLLIFYSLSEYNFQMKPINH